MFSAAFIADLVVAIHLGYVLFTVGGELLILIGAPLRWKWIRRRWFRIVHLAAVALVAVEALVGFLCPLTQLEHYLRQSAGQQVETEISFVGRLIRSILFYDFPGWFFTALYIGFALVVILTYLCIPSGHHQNRQTQTVHTESK